MTASRRLLTVVFAVYLAAGATFNVTFPLGEGPDEPAHFAYVQFVARQGTLPVLVPEYQENASVEAYQAPLYYVLGALLTFPWMDTDPAVEYRPPASPGGPPAFHHSARAAFPWAGGTLAWHLLRFFSLALGAISLWVAYRTARHCFESEAPAVAATAYLALNPQFVYIHSLVSNDSMATLAGSLLVLHMVRIARGREPLQPAWTGLWIALAVLAKASVVLVAGGLGVLLWNRRMRLTRSWRDGLATLGPLAVVPSLLAGWWVLRNLWLYGDLTGASMSMRVVPQNHYAAPLGLAGFLRILPELAQATLRSCWASFGWTGVELPRRVFNALALVHLITWGRLLPSLWRGRLRSEAAAVLAMSAGTLLAGYGYYNTFTNHAGWQGRLLFPGASIAAIVFVAGWRRFFLGRELAAAVGIVAAESLLLIWVYFRIIVPAYW